MQWGKQQKLAVEAITAGDFQSALKHLKHDRFQNTATGQRVARRLTFALVERAEHCTATGNLHQAWSDLMLASSISIPRDSDAISRKKNQLVELTVETAETFLANGQATHALRAIEELASRQIMDWRADRLTKTANLLLGADESAATGQLADSMQQLEQAKNLHPELGFIESRLAASRQRQMQVRDLTSVLQEKTVKGDWAEVRLCCQKLLAIAPEYRIALDAQKHCLAQMQRQTSAGSRLTHIPSQDSGDSFFRIDDDANEVDAEEDTAERAAAVANTFLLWVDGAGGFLVCPAARNVIGQAVPGAAISIPILGDLRRHHARLATIDDQHFLEFLGNELERSRPVEKHLALGSGQILDFDGGVKLRYSKTHPLSSTARIDFVSRHRTQPWSDAILLAGQSIILGPNPNNHVYCPTWEDDLILFRRGEQWFCRSKHKIEIDGKEFDFEGPLERNSTVAGEDFSLTLEPAFSDQQICCSHRDL
jgi:hypothetical protein